MGRNPLGRVMLGETARAVGSLGLAAGRRIPGASLVLGRGARLSLDGKVVLITGAARGLGAELARQSHGRGATVVLVGRRLDGVQRIADDLGDRALAFEADVSDLGALERAAAGAVESFGGIDVVIANAGIAPPSDSMLTIDPDEFERTVDIDLLGQWRTVRAVLPSLTERHGHVVVVSSIYAFFNGVLNASYAASKAGIEQLVRALRVELVHHGATAGVAYLGFIDTELVSDAFAQSHVEQFRAAMPSFVTRPMTVEAAARAVLDGVETRSARITAPAWVLPMLRARGLVTTVMDEILMQSTTLARVVRDAEIARRAQP